MKELLINLIQRQKSEREQILRDSTVAREMTSRLQASLNRKLIKAVIGPRRSGKSSLIHQVLALSSEPYAYLNFEDEQLPLDVDFSLIEAAFAEVYPDATIYFFDEIQVLPRWEQLLNRLERSGKRLVISGSNSKLLSSELSSALTGRHEIFEVLPFSFREFRQAWPDEKQETEAFKTYLRTGGFPDVVMNRVQSQSYLRELWDAIVLQDIVQRYKVRSVTELKSLLSLVRDSIASPLSHRSLERAMLKRLSIATIGKFIAYAQGAYLAFTLENFSFKSRERVNSDKKTYLFDNGFYTSMKVGSQEDNGKLLENFVFISLIRKGLKPNLDFFYYKARSGREVDFVVLESGKPVSLVQSSWSVGSQTTLERELSALSEAARDLHIKSAIIVTLHEKGTHSRDGVTIRSTPIVEFLDSIDWGA